MLSFPTLPHCCFSFSYLFAPSRRSERLEHWLSHTANGHYGMTKTHSKASKCCDHEQSEILGHRRNNPYTVKPLLSRHLRDLPKCPFNRGCKNCAMFVNNQHSMVTQYCDKLHVVKQAIQLISRVQVHYLS